MKRFLILAIVMGLIVSCASISIDEKNGLYEYKRTGNQELHGLTLELQKSADGSAIVKAGLNDQKSEREIAEVLLAISDNVNKALEILNELQKKFPGLF